MLHIAFLFVSHAPQFHRIIRSFMIQVGSRLIFFSNQRVTMPVMSSWLCWAPS